MAERFQTCDLGPLETPTANYRRFKFYAEESRLQTNLWAPDKRKYSTTRQLPLACAPTCKTSVLEDLGRSLPGQAKLTSTPWRRWAVCLSTHLTTLKLL
jgi:hypothetical protein